MRTIKSYERSTGQGDLHGTQVMLSDGDWLFVSQFPEATHVGRVHGWEVYTLVVSPYWRIRAYHRFKSGRENIIPGVALN